MTESSEMKAAEPGVKSLKSRLLTSVFEGDLIGKSKPNTIRMIEESRYLLKQPFRTRGHAQLVMRAEGIFSDIDTRLQCRDRVRVLELGCGFGTVLLELRQRYGPRVDLHGINRRTRDGDIDTLLRNGYESRLIEPSVNLMTSLPMISYVDVAKGLPFPDDSFDIVFSQVSWRYFGNKVGVLREISRTLRDDGLAKIDADELRPSLPEEYRRLVEIWKNGRLIPFGEYIKAFGMSLLPTEMGEYLRFGKLRGFGDNLEPVLEINLSEIQDRWNGIKCVYRMK